MGVLHNLVIDYIALMKKISRVNKLIQKMESFCKIRRKSKMKILSIKASTFPLITLVISRIKFINDTLSSSRAIMSLNYRLIKLYTI